MDFTRLALEVPRDCLPVIHDTSLIGEISEKYDIEPPLKDSNGHDNDVDLIRWGMEFQAVMRVMMIGNIEQQLKKRGVV